MKRIAPVLGLLALFVLIPGALRAADNPPAAAVAPAAVPVSVEGFLATLSNGQPMTPDLTVLPPAPDFLSTTCTSDEECPAGQKCCYPCGIDGCDFICMEVERNRCPFFP